MSEQPKVEQSKLIGALREGVALVQMVFFKEIKAILEKKHPDKDLSSYLMLAGAITNELFGTPNPEEKFVAFRQENRALIEEEMSGLADSLPHLGDAAGASQLFLGDQHGHRSHVGRFLEGRKG